MLFNFQFILSGTYNNTSNSGQNVSIKNFYVNTYDIDGNGNNGTNQYNEFQQFSTFELGSNTDLEVLPNPSQNLTKFRSISSNNNGTTLSDASRVRLTYSNPVSTLNVKVGSEGSGLAYFYLDFSTGPTFSSSVPVQVTASTTNSTITSAPSSIAANGITTSTISIQLKDANGNNLTSSVGAVVVTTTSGSLGTVVDNNNGTYTVTLTSATSATTATLGFSINGTTATATTTVAFTAVSVANLVISNSGTSLTSFNSCQGSASTAQTFSVSGTNLTSNVTVTAPTGYELSLTAGGTFTGSVSITASGTLSATPVYVRMAASATGTPNGNITVVSGWLHKMLLYRER